MSGRMRVKRLLVALGSATLTAVSVLTLQPAPVVRAADPPQYYAIPVGWRSGVTGGSAMNELGVVVALKDDRIARVSESGVESVGPAGGYPSAITDSGAIVGYTPAGAIRIDGTTVTNLPGIGGTFEAAHDINEAGTTIVGSSNFGSETRSWVHVGGTTTELESLGGDYTYATKVNDSGLIAGVARVDQDDMRIVTWQNGDIQDLGDLGAYYGGVTDINEAGDVLATYGVSGAGDRGAFWDGTTLVDIPTLGGTSMSTSSMNEAGDVVGTSLNASGRWHAFFWDGGPSDDLGTLPGGSESWGGGINDQGQIVGTSDIGGNKQHGFLVDGGVMYDLNDLVPPDTVEIVNAERIADSGHILASNQTGPILLVPGTPPPAAYDVIDLGAGLGPAYDAYPTDMNAAREATGSIESRAFYYDGTTSSRIFAGFSESNGMAINAGGTAAGYADNGGHLEAFRYDGSVQFLGTLGGQNSFAWDINDTGDIVGQAEVASGSSHAFLYRGGTMIDLHTLGGVTSVATDINEAGTVIGNYSPSNGQFRGFVSDGTTTTDLGTLGGSFTAPWRINESGVIVGTTSTSTQQNHAFLYENGTMTSVAPPGSTMSDALAINESGVIAGSYVSAGLRRGFVWDDGQFTLIPGTGDFATVTDINEAGQVIGYDSNGGFLFDQGTLVYLADQIPVGHEANIQTAIEIADDGTILARGATADSRTLALLLVPTTPQEPPLTIDTSISAPASVAKLGRFEKKFTLDRSYGFDVHDPDVIDVTATFTAPGGATYTAPAFFGTDYTLRPGTGIGGSEFYDPVPGTESGVWHVRFSPDEVGTWTYRIRAEDKTPGAESVALSGTLSFSATPSSAHGQIERDPRDDRFLRHADGTPYYPMGHNVAFGDGNPFNDGSHYFEPHFASMQAAGQNWTRVWMTDFYITTLEWSATHWSGQYDGVGQYGDIPAFRVEQILDLAEQYDLEVQLVLNDHGQFSSYVDARWYDNPYNDANGGPIPSADPTAFFTDPTARDLFKQRLRYLVARYGAYRDILAWELFNEAQFVGSAASNPGNDQGVRDDVVAWHAEMAAYLRSLDPYDHLITTSSDISTSMADIWDDPNIDLVQVHDYGSNTGRDQRFQGYAEDLNATYGKPVIIGEFGLSGQPELNFDPTTSALTADRVAHLTQATHLHNSAWASAMSASGAMSWWWGGYIRNDAARHRVTPDFPANERINPPLRDFFAGEDLAGMGLASSGITAPASVVALGLDNGSEGFAWIRDAQNTYASGVGPGDLAGRTMTGIQVGFDGFADGSYRIEVHDPWGVDPMDDSILATAAGGTLTVQLPQFTRDLAIKVRPAGPATTEHPVVAAVASPVPGLITITESPTTDPPPVGSGYTFLDAQLDITAPTATAANPLSIVFTVDAALLASVDPDLTATTLTVFRNGVPVDACTPSGADAPATPDPCVSLRETLSGGADAGDARITVLTSVASTWNVGSPPMLTAPGAPTGVTATRGDRQATVTWTPPTNDGGSQITGYTVTSNPGNRTASVNGTTTTGIVTGLTNGTSYTFTVTATNAIGTGPASAPSNAVTPAALLAQTITFPKPANTTLLASPLTVTATASSGLPVTLTSTTPSVCTVSGLVVTLLTAGTCTLIATQPGDATYRAANPITRSFTISKASQTITFARPANTTMLASPLTVTATASSGLPVTLASTTPTVCTVNGFEITLLTAGTCAITATQPGNDVYNAATAVTRSFTVSQATQTITFPRPANTNLLASPLTVTATASSGLPVTLTSSTTAVCTVSGFEVTLLTTGTCTLTASQPGNTIYRAANSITRSFAIAKAPQTITLPDPGAQSMQSPSVVLSPTASSGLPVTLTSTTTGVCTVSGYTVTFLRTGTCRVRATQPGDAVYAAAPAVTLPITVGP